MNCGKCAYWGEGRAFCDLVGSPRKLVDSFKLTSRHPAGSILFAEGERPRGVYLVCEASVKLSMSVALGRSIALKSAKPGQVLGLDAVISDRPYHATATTEEPCQVDFVSRDDFLRLLRQSSAATMNAVRQLSDDYENACNHVRSLHLNPLASERLARFLLEAAKGQEVDPVMRVRLTQTQKEIGQMIGASTSRVKHALRRFRDQNLLTKKGSLLLIESREGLERYIQGEAS